MGFFCFFFVFFFVFFLFCFVLFFGGGSAVGFVFVLSTLIALFQSPTGLQQTFYVWNLPHFTKVYSGGLGGGGGGIHIASYAG